ncbi:hypothetical protein JHK85_011214 [Glycine max]|nr:hypothetical protein JHK85_011214 [Glycine max]
MEKWVALVLLLVFWKIREGFGVKAEEVTYDGRSLIIDGQRKILFSGLIHYPRSTPQMWPDLIAKAKQGGLDVIQTYVFWNLHEPQPGMYDFRGRYDLVGFIKEIQAQGLGFPFWLHDVPGIVYRTDNESFKAFGTAGSQYVQWAAKMAVGLNTGVPWVMCKQTDAPDPVINTCNGMRCGETFTGPNSPNKPALWTENWTSFYQVYGGLPYIRSAEDIAFHVTLFIARNGSYVNYYMYHGGTNFGRTASAYVITGYYDQAPLDEYGKQPKWGHLKQLHEVIKSCSTTLLQGVQRNFSLGQLQEGYVFEEEKGECVAFLKNNDRDNKVTVQFRNRSYELLPRSISILPDCQNVAFNTANVNTTSNRRIISPKQNFSSLDDWKQFQDVIPYFDNTSLRSDSLLEQMNTTKDKSDYLWYTLRFAGLISVELQCSEQESLNLTNSTWGYQTTFDTPEGDDPVVLDLSSMGKGEAWVNEQSIGRYWILFHDSKGNPSQSLYHVPRSFLKDTGNVLVLVEEGGGNPLVALSGNVSYDGRSLLIDGQRKLLISASIHYPRSVPAMWPGLVQTAKEGGVDVIETYVFWNGHELSPGNYYFGGRFDLVKFAKTVQQAGMYLILRIGPFVAAEWNFGGVPVWLHYVPGTVFRTYNQPFMIENEYGYYENFYKEDGKKYALWAAKMAVSQNTGVPWIMCQQWDAPDPVIDTCNSFYCDQFTPTSPNRPKIWTENWPGWFKTFGGRDPHRPAEDVAFSVARFFQKAGGPFITTSYDYDAPVDEYGLPRLPKWGHLKELHRAIKLCEHVLLNGKSVNISLGPSVEADVYTDSSGACAAFISNVDDKNDKTVEFRNASYHLPAWSVSILPDCKNVVFNTAKVTSQTNVVAMIPESLQQSDKGVNSLKWDIVKEKPGIWGKADFVKSGFVDLINTTKDTTDYLWHTTSIFVSENEEFLKKGSKPVLLIESTGHALHAFVNQEYQGTGTGNGTHSPFSFKNPISLRAGKNEIALLCLTVGLQTAGPFYDFIGAGLTSVKIKGLKNGTIDLSSYAWTYKIGVQGEYLRLYQGNGLNKVNWTSTSEPQKMQPLTWYKAIVDAPPGDEPVGLDMLHMGKGLAWLNGEEIGRYWPRKSEFKSEDCVKECDYRGKFNPDKCDTGCGEPTQRWYHVPRSWFKPSGNILVLFEEKGGDPEKIKFVRRKVSGACALVAEDYPSVGLLSQGEDKIQNNKNVPFAHLTCPSNTRISAVKFASFGTPSGSCGSYLKGDCHDPNSSTIVEKACLNKNDCVIKLTEENFKTNLCPGLSRKLAVEAVCS